MIINWFGKSINQKENRNHSFKSINKLAYVQNFIRSSRGWSTTKINLSQSNINLPYRSHFISSTSHYTVFRFINQSIEINISPSDSVSMRLCFQNSLFWQLNIPRILKKNCCTRFQIVQKKTEHKQTKNPK